MEREGEGEERRRRRRKQGEARSKEQGEGEGGGKKDGGREGSFFFSPYFSLEIWHRSDFI